LWVNVDFVANGNGVIGHNLCEGIPFEDERFDVVYHSHLLEHFPRPQASQFLRACYRVIKRKGIIRIAVPDLERIAELYLKALEKVAQGDKEWEGNYEWMKLELYDQVVRERSGGEMAAYLSQEHIPNKAFVIGRIGIEGERIIERAERNRSVVSSEPPQPPTWRRLLNEFRQMLHATSSVREWAIRRILGPEYDLLKLSRFRRGGEIHLWMYDRYSLAQILREVGFASPKALGPTESGVPDWESYHLDTEPDGRIYRPDSLYMEAVKP
jgi:SAM-dependent methyltransferase